MLKLAVRLKGDVYDRLSFERKRAWYEAYVNRQEEKGQQYHSQIGYAVALRRVNLKRRAV